MELLSLTMEPRGAPGTISSSSGVTFGLFSNVPGVASSQYSECVGRDREREEERERRKDGERRDGERREGEKKGRDGEKERVREERRARRKEKKRSRGGRGAGRNGRWTTN